MGNRTRTGLAVLVCAWLMVASAWAQVTTGSVAGTVADTQGGVVPGVTVTLVSDTRGTRMAPVITNTSGDFIVPNVAADTYTVEVALAGFKTLRRAGVVVSGGDRVSVGTLSLEVGGTSETVDVKAEAPLIQSQSGERSFSVPTSTSDQLPLSRANFASLAAFTPGVSGTNRLGGGGQNNYQMDGVSTMDTGNNGQLITMNMEAIAEVKVLASGYQAEYGRSSGLQITAVTKGGSNQFHGSVYDVERNSDWDSRSWAARQNGDPKSVSKQKDWGYSVGGPVGRASGDNKLFFFYSHEYRPRTSGGGINRFRVPTELERRGDFSESLNNQGVRINLIRDASTGQPCTAANTSGCFRDGGVLGRIPQNRLYGPSLMALSYNGLLPLPNHVQVAGENFNLESTQPINKTLTTQPAVRLDYQLSDTLRFTGKYAGQLQASKPVPGSLPGFNDSQNFTPSRYTWSTTVNWTMNPTTFIEGTYGLGRNALGTMAISPSAARSLSGMTDLPMPFKAPDGSNSSVLPSNYYAVKILDQAGVPWFNGSAVSLVPSFSWGNLIGNNVPSATGVGGTTNGVPNINLNRTQDATVSVTKVFSRHTLKAGIYWNHAFKAQGLGAAGAATYAGVLSFANDPNNPFDSGFGFSNAALGVFNTYQQQSTYVEGGYLYNNIDWYVQDNWRVNSRLTLDYGMRFVWMQPTYDERMQSSNFFEDQWSLANAPRMYVPTCPNNVNPCSTGARQAMDPLTKVSLGQGSSFAIGQIVPNTGSLTNGIIRAGQGISKYNYTWPTVVAAPRFGFAYDLSGTQRFVVRGSVGLFHDRPAGDSMYSQVGNPPYSTSKTVRNALLADLGSGVSLQGPPQLTSIWPYETDIPASWQWSGGVQMTLPFASSLDVSYVGQHGWNRLNDDRGLSQVDINAPDLGSAFLAQNRDLTIAASATPGAGALSTDLMRPFRGFGQIGLNLPRFWDEYHSIQTSLNRRFRNGFSAGLNWTIGLSTTSNRGLNTRLDHAADGSWSIRADQAEYEKLNENAGNQRHVLKGNFVYDLPDLSSRDNVGWQVVRTVVNDWQLAGVLTAASGGRYDVGFTYAGGIGNVNMTGSPTYPARVVINGDPGSGCSDHQYAQFDTSLYSGPTSPSLGLESGRNYLSGCFTRSWDIAISRNIRLGGGRAIQLRLEAFNAFNTVVFTNRVTNMQLSSLTNPTLTNSQFLPDGSVDPARLKPNQAGFGAVTGAQAARTVQAQIRFQF